MFANGGRSQHLHHSWRHGGGRRGFGVGNACRRSLPAAVRSDPRLHRSHDRGAGIVQPDGRAVVQVYIPSAALLERLLFQAFEQAPTPRTTNIVIAGGPLIECADVNRDGFVSPLDALLVINHLNAAGPARSLGDSRTAAHLDVNSDGVVSPIDALLIINFLNAGSRSDIAGEGERESLAAVGTGAMYGGLPGDPTSSHTIVNATSTWLPVSLPSEILVTGLRKSGVRTDGHATYRPREPVPIPSVIAMARPGEEVNYALRFAAEAPRDAVTLDDALSDIADDLSVALQSSRGGRVGCRGRIVRPAGLVENVLTCINCRDSAGHHIDGSWLDHTITSFVRPACDDRNAVLT